jgi:hypothetical protein
MAIPLKVEQEWARRYPIAEASAQDIVLSLWNYPVAKSDLSTEHRHSLKEFLAAEFLQLQLGRTTTTLLFVTGHASDSGEERSNRAISRARAEKVARFLVSEGYPAAQIRVEAAGSSEPADTGNNGLAASRNRRVEVLRFAPSEPAPKPPVDTIELPPPPPPPESKPTFKLPEPTMSGANIERVISLDFPTYRSPNVLVSGNLQAILKGKITDKGDGFTAGASFKSGGLSAKVEAEIADHVKAKFGVDAKDNEAGFVFKGGAEFSDVRLKPEIGLQAKETYLYVTVTLVDRPMPDLEVEGLHITGSVTVKGTISFAPGPAMLARMAALAPEIAVGALPVVVAALILAATIAGIEQAKAEGLRFARLIALRDGIATRVAYEIVGNDAEVAFRERRLEWRHTENALETEFVDGANAVNALLRNHEKSGDPGRRDDQTNQWTSKYAQDGNRDFTTLRKRVFDAVGAYEREGGLEDSMARL